MCSKWMNEIKPQDKKKTKQIAIYLIKNWKYGHRGLTGLERRVDELKKDFKKEKI